MRMDALLGTHKSQEFAYSSPNREAKKVFHARYLRYASIQDCRDKYLQYCRYSMREMKRSYKEERAMQSSKVAKRERERKRKS
jgi:hypothetical protein